MPDGADPPVDEYQGDYDALWVMESFVETSIGRRNFLATEIYITPDADTDHDALMKEAQKQVDDLDLNNIIPGLPFVRSFRY